MDPTPADDSGSGVRPPAGHRSAAAPGASQQVSSELYRLLVASVRDYAIFALDPNGVILSWNAGAERIKGYTADEIIGKHFSIFYPHDLVAEGFPEFELRTAANTGRFEDEGWRLRKDGSRFWANVVITALRDETGRLVGFAKVTRDLTERREAEESLRESEERFRLLVEGVKDYAIFMLDPDGRVVTWNSGAERIKGYRGKEIIGQHFSRFYTDEDRASHKPQFELEVASRTGQYEEEGWRVRKDGTLFWAGVLIAAVRNKAGELVGYTKVTRDLTERRAAQERALEDARRVAGESAARRAAEERQEELLELANRLKRQAAELEEERREAEESRRLAEESRIRADEANHAKSQFLAAMSHELRTPLNAIGGYTDLLAMGLSGPLTPQQEQQLGRIKRSQTHLLGIINDILNFSRIEAGQLIYTFSTVSMRDAIEAVTQMVMPQAVGNGLQLDTQECDGSIVVRADRAKLEQILLNLLSNAMKFTQTGGRITLACEAHDDKVTVLVRDTGSGIPAEKLEPIFEPFVQVGRSLTAPAEGTGLGLAISRDLARAMGGDITVESTVGKGSEFRVTLPAELEAKKG
jgi:PAS domain S-box-containing protein